MVIGHIFRCLLFVQGHSHFFSLFTLSFYLPFCSGVNLANYINAVDRNVQIGQQQHSMIFQFSFSFEVKKTPINWLA